ncbi:branched-chain amino acid ABC transporter permease [Mangrovactinospora gilvigrisea]|uniref:Branched-chain amino acid ABC transporter permease n=1 Tax=Mangrovactinospora gilvigrisea TaxID=1428644 RepID=A0A1J7C1G0_9ACTN|nr:branched-chain amino acid ABC transporter permease [Mangrovactinospora gilvigrisea]OIV35412.1 branched-chain amino acid ABC transporter permease [Mangrovactinospora gilvigrisea]
MSSFLDYLTLGIVLGSMYAIFAIGYTLVYGVLQLINFAHSEVFMTGGFVGMIVLTEFAPSRPHGFPSVLWMVIGCLSGMVGGAAIAWCLERVAYRPLRKAHAPRLVFLLSAVGASFFLYNLCGKLFGRTPIQVPSLYTNSVLFHWPGTSVEVRVNQVVVVGAAVVMMIALDRVVNRTKLGSGIRAVAQDAETAGLMGVDIDRVVSRTFVIGGLLGGAAGFLYGYAVSGQVVFTMGFVPGIKAFAAAVLGGIGNVRGAMLGGLLLGVIESFTVPLLGSEWIDVAAFVILVLVLMFRPTGLLGERLGRSA